MNPVHDRSGKAIGAADYVRLNSGQIRQITAVVSDAELVYGMYGDSSVVVIAENLVMVVDSPGNLFFSGSVELVPAPTTTGDVACGIVWGT